MNVYATVAEVKQILGGTQKQAVEGKHDDIIKAFCIDASRMFDTWATNGVNPKRRFYPLIAARTFAHPTGHVSELRLRDDLLELTTLTTKNGATTVLAADSFLTGPNGNEYQTPFQRIKLKENGTTTVFEFDGTKLGSNSVTGVWGYHDEWADAWQDSTDVVKDAAGIDASVTSIEVADVDGNDINGLPFRFKEQQLIRIESEYMWITDMDRGSPQSLTVRRGMNGSTAAAHALDTQIDTFVPMNDVRLAMRTLVTFLYERKDSIGTQDDRPMAGPDGVLVLPHTLPKEVTGILKAYKKDAL